MQKCLTCLLLFACLQSGAQSFFYYPLPMGKADFKKLELAGVKICYEYKVEDGEKYLNSILEYGAKGLPAAWYERGLNEEGDSALITEITYAYNSNMDIASSTYVDHETGERSKTAFFYDGNKRLVRKLTTSIDPPTYLYSYDAKNRLKEVTVSIEVPAYDEEGNSSGKSVQRPSYKLTFSHDAKNRIAEEWYFLPDENGKYASTPERKTKWEYNTQNQVVKIIQLDNEGSEYAGFTIEYNQQGLLKRLVKTGFDGAEEEYIYKYCTDCKQSWMQ